MKRKKIYLAVILMGVFSMLFGCAKNEADTITPVSLPKDMVLTGFQIHHEGMEFEPYYILHATDAGTYMKITNINPHDDRMLEGKEIGSLSFDEFYFGYADTIKACENAENVLLADDAPVRRLEEAIEQSGALAWDGYDETRKKKGADSGDRYALYLELSDGTTVAMTGYNICPAGFEQLLSQAREIFEENV